MEACNVPCDKSNVLKRTQLNIMKEDLIALKAVLTDFSMLPIERMRAKEQSDNLSILIESHERAMERSKSIFKGGQPNG